MTATASTSGATSCWAGSTITGACWRWCISRTSAGTSSEFAISVVESLRGSGHGQRLTRQALRIAADLGYGVARIQFLAANRPMAAILDHFAGSHQADGSERLVNVPLPAVLRRAFKPPLGPLGRGFDIQPGQSTASSTSAPSPAPSPSGMP